MIRSGETTDLFINLDCKGFITVKLHFLDPVSVQKIPDREGHHGWDKRKDVCGHTSNGDAQKGQKVQAEYEQLFTSVVTFRRCDDQKVKKINVLRFLRKKTDCHKCLIISYLEL